MLHILFFGLVRAHLQRTRSIHSAIKLSRLYARDLRGIGCIERIRQKSSKLRRIVISWKDECQMPDLEGNG